MSKNNGVIGKYGMQLLSSARNAIKRRFSSRKAAVLGIVLAVFTVNVLLGSIAVFALDSTPTVAINDQTFYLNSYTDDITIEYALENIDDLSMLSMNISGDGSSVAVGNLTSSYAVISASDLGSADYTGTAVLSYVDTANSVSASDTAAITIVYDTEDPVVGDAPVMTVEGLVDGTYANENSVLKLAFKAEDNKGIASVDVVFTVGGTEFPAAISVNGNDEYEATAQLSGIPSDTYDIGYEIVAVDKAGNKASKADAAALTDVKVDLVAPSLPGNVLFAANGTVLADGGYCPDAGEITVTIVVADSDIKGIAVSCDGQTVDAVTENGKTFVATFAISSLDLSDNTIECLVTAADYAEHSTSESYSISTTKDDGVPTLELKVNGVSDSLVDVVTGDVITVSVKVTDTTLEKVECSNLVSGLTELEDAIAGSEYTYEEQITVADDFFTATGEYEIYKVVAEDEFGNSYMSTAKVNYIEPITASAEMTAKDDMVFTAAGSQIPLEISVDNTDVDITDVVIYYVKADGTTGTVTAAVPAGTANTVTVDWSSFGLDDDDVKTESFIYAVVTVADDYGQTAQLTTDASIKFIANKATGSVVCSAYSDLTGYESKVVIKNGTLYFTIKSAERLMLPRRSGNGYIKYPYATVKNTVTGRSANATFDETEQDGYFVYTASMVMDPNNDNTRYVANREGMLNITFSSRLNGSTVVNTALSSDVINIYYDITAPTVEFNGVTTTGKTEGTTTYISPDDTVTIKLNVQDGHTDSVNNTVYIKINGYTKEIVTTQNPEDITLTVSASDLGMNDQEKVVVTYSATDAYGNAGAETTKNTEIVYLANLEEKNASITTDNAANSSAVVNGNTVTVEISYNHNVKASASGSYLTIGDEKVPFDSITSNGGKVVAVYTVPADADFENTAAIGYHIEITDNAGNSIESDCDESSKLTYYAPLSISTPSYKKISDTSLIPASVLDMIKNSKYIKEGDTIEIGYTANQDIASCTITCGATTVTEASPEYSVSGKTASVDVAVNNCCSDMDNAVITLTLTDIAGQTLNTTIDTDLIYYAPIDNSSVALKSNNLSGFIKNGSTVKVTAECENGHIIAAPGTEVSINNRDLDVTVNGSSAEANLVIPKNETVMNEGYLAYTFTMYDMAGNAFTVTKTSDICYDRSAPAVSLNPNLDGFSNESITITANASERNAAVASGFSEDNSIIITINGQKQTITTVADGDTEFSRAFTFVEDGTYEISIYAVDRAGNASGTVSAQIIIDRTAPVVTTVLMGEADENVYAKGFVIADYINITETNLLDIYCKVSDSNGTEVVDIYDPIMTDGKKTITIIVTDMAGNSSATLTFDIIIDAIAPLPVIREILSDTLLEVDKTKTFVGEMTLELTLTDLRFDPNLQVPDEFTVLKIVDEDGELVVDLLAEGPDEDGVYRFTVEEFGEYTLIVEATDHTVTVKGEPDSNETGELIYKFVFEDESWFNKLLNNKVLLFSIIGGILGLGILSVALAVVLNKINGKEDAGKDDNDDEKEEKTDE